MEKAKGRQRTPDAQRLAGLARRQLLSKLESGDCSLSELLKVLAQFDGQEKAPEGDLRIVLTEEE